jgi:hypothetical protein
MFNTILNLVLLVLAMAGAAIAGVHFLRVRRGRRMNALVLGLGAALLALLLAPYPPLVVWYQTSVLLPLALIPLVMLFAGRLYLQAKRVLSAQPGIRSWEVFLSLALSGLLVLAGGQRLFWFLVWDSTYDPIGLLFAVPLVLAGMVIGAGLTLDAPGRPVLPRLGYLLVFPVLVAGVYAAAGQVDAAALTEERQERIAAALERYHAQRGEYPHTLSALTPVYLPAVPAPLRIHGQDWCYLSTGSSYQLAYLDRDHWSSPHLTAAAYHPAGSVDDLRQVCAEQIAVQQQRQPWTSWHTAQRD